MGIPLKIDSLIVKKWHEYQDSKMNRTYTILTIIMLINNCQVIVIYNLTKNTRTRLINRVEDCS